MDHEFERHARRLEMACSIIQAVRDELTFDKVVEGIVESLVEVGGLVGAEIEIDAAIENLQLRHAARAGERSSDPALLRRAPVFIRGIEIGAITTYSQNPEDFEAQSELLEFVLPTLFMGLDHAASFAEVVDYRNTLEKKVEQRTSELAEAHLQLTQTVADLREAKAARDRFFANINHEIRTPLTLIQLAIDTISQQGDRLPSDARQKLDDVHGSSRRLLHLVDSLLVLAAGDEGKLHVRPRDLEIGGCLQRIVRNWATAADHGGIALSYEGPAVCDACLDEGALETITGNLLSNAVKFTPRGGRVTVSLRETTDTITLRVRDTGPGLDPEFLPRMFGRFERSRRAATQSVRGTGIGLSLTKELVEIQRGTISVTRHEDPTGTSFEVTLPRYQAIVAVVPDTSVSHGVLPPTAPEALELDAPQEPEVGTIEATIVLAEDDAGLARHVAEILSRHYRVHVAQDGEAALELAKQLLPDMLVTDLEMPTMNGLELTRRFLELDGTRLSPVLIISAHAGLAERLAGFEAGAVDYVLKPFSAPELLARVRSQLALRKIALKLHESEKLVAMGVLSAGLAHELRNPANAVVNAIEPLWRLFPEAQRQPDSVVEELFQILRTGAVQIRDQCRNILDFATASAVSRQPEHLGALLRRTKLVLAEALSKVRVVEHVEFDEPMWCSGPLVEQILINLLDNAAYAAGPHGEIRIVARREGASAVIEVGDSGPGVPAHLHQRIFDPFFTTKPIGKGTGLGLSVSRRIALNHGGDLRVVRRGDATVFRLELPQPELGLASPRSG